MAKAKLTYDLNDSDDAMEHLRAIKSTDMALVLFELIYNTRKRMEYKIESENLDAYDLLDKIMEELADQLDEHGIIINDLIR